MTSALQEPGAVSVCTMVFTRQRGFLSRPLGSCEAIRSCVFRRGGGKKCLEDFWGFFKHPPGVPGQVDPAGGQGRCRTQVFKLGENKVLLIIIMNLRIALHTCTLLHQCGPTSLMWNHLDRKTSLLLLRSRVHEGGSARTVFLFGRGIVLWRGKRAF